MAVKKKIKKPKNQEEQWRTPQKRMRGEGIFYGEPKSEQINLRVTPTAKKKLTELAESSGISMAEVVERWLRNLLGDEID